MSEAVFCYKCGAPVGHDEKAFCKKAINPDSTEFLCLSCLSERCRLSEEEILAKIDYLKKHGCTLFFM